MKKSTLVNTEDYRLDVVMLRDLVRTIKDNNSSPNIEFHTEYDDGERPTIFKLEHSDCIQIFSEYRVTFVKTFSDGKIVVMLRDF